MPKNDELSTYLSNKYEYYVTGEENANLVLYGSTDENGIVVPRFLAMQLGINYNPYIEDIQEIKNKIQIKYKKGAKLKLLLQCGRRFALMGRIDYLLICYPSLPQYNSKWEESVKEYEMDKVKFYIYTPRNDERKLINGKMLREKICEKLNNKSRTIGTKKSKNKSLADYFHLWSGENLPSSIVKLDIDGLFLKENDQILVEIKRSNIPPIPKWHPYKDDAPDFRLLDAFAKKIDAQFWLLHHDGKNECSAETIISFYDIDCYEESQDVFLKYRKSIDMLKLEGENSLETIIKDKGFLHTIFQPRS